MNALITSYLDYLWIALFTICIAKIVWVIVGAILDDYLRKKKFSIRPINTLNLLEASYKFEVTRVEVENALQKDVKQKLIKSYTLGDDFIVYSKKGGRKELIDLSRYNVEQAVERCLKKGVSGYFIKKVGKKNE